MAVELVMDPILRNVTIAFQILGGVVIIVSLAISWRQLQLQKKEVIQQNDKIIELLKEINEGVNKK